MSDAEASHLKSALQEGLSWSDETLLRAKDGTRRATILRTNCIFDGSGDVVGYIYLMTDITQRKQTEEQLRASLKEKEVLKLNDLIAEWVLKYLILGREHGRKECENVKSLFQYYSCDKQLVDMT